MAGNVKTMTCVECGRKKAYPDAFPDRAYAECWLCFWKRHVEREHRPKPRRVRRVFATFLPKRKVAI